MVRCISRNAANNQMLGSAADGELITVPADDERVVRWTFEQSDFYWSEKEIDTFAATKAENSGSDKWDLSDYNVNKDRNDPGCVERIKE